jgi:hypothetical protein
MLTYIASDIRCRRSQHKIAGGRRYRGWQVQFVIRFDDKTPAYPVPVTLVISLN